MLYLVATPIGNLADFSPRARTVLETVDLVACEDTRTSGQLFSLLGVKVKKMVSYHDFNEEKATSLLLQKLIQGTDVALVSDAGMPLISDPGYKLVHACRKQGIEITSIPGANAGLMALQLSGLPTDRFYFRGFLPPKSSERQSELKKLKYISATLIFYETARRLDKVLSDLFSIFGNRETAVVRELTKKFEQVRTGTLSDLIQAYQSEGLPKGEIVLVVAGNKEEKTQNATSLDIAVLRTFLSAKDTAHVVALNQNISKKEAYEQVLASDKLS